MNRQEMLERLNRGEHPLDVSIQKWKEFVIRLENTGFQNVLRNDFESVTCALCQSNNNCGTCVYLLHYGYTCASYVDKTAWYRFISAYEYEDVERGIQAAQDMVKELEEIKTG